MSVSPSPMEVLEALHFTAHDVSMLAQSPTDAILRPTPAALLLMRAIDCAGQPMTISHVAERMGCSIQNASESIGRLERDGWLRSVGDSKRRRDRPFELTERGTWVLDTSLDRVGPPLAEAIGMLTSREQRTLLRYLRKLSKAAGRKDLEMDPIALGRAELGKPELRDELEERNRRAYLQMLKLSRGWGIPLDDLRKSGFHVPDPPGKHRHAAPPEPPPPDDDGPDDEYEYDRP